MQKHIVVHEQEVPVDGALLDGLVVDLREAPTACVLEPDRQLGPQRVGKEPQAPTEQRPLPDLRLGEGRAGDEARALHADSPLSAPIGSDSGHSGESSSSMMVCLGTSVVFCWSSSFCTSGT